MIAKETIAKEMIAKEMIAKETIAKEMIAKELMKLVLFPRVSNCHGLLHLFYFYIHCILYWSKPICSISLMNPSQLSLQYFGHLRPEDSHHPILLMKCVKPWKR